jgi:hypothetical protein
MVPDCRGPVVHTSVNTAAIGDLIKLKHNPYHGELIGIVVDKGIDEIVVYGDGIERSKFIKIRWFNKKFPSVYRFTEGFTQFEILSKAQNNA